VKSKGRIVMVLSLAIVVAIAGLFTLDFRGYFDQGTFELLQYQTSPNGKIAMLAKRSDHEALSGDIYFFVVIADHVYSPKELRFAEHSSRLVFAAALNGLHLRWNGPSELVIACESCGTTKNYVDNERYSDDGISIRYVGFPQ
jgi:hypothetical protein